MTKLRNTIIGAATAGAALALVAAPAGAAQSHPKFIRSVEKTAPGLKQFKSSYLSSLGTTICAALRAGDSVNDVATTLVNATSNGNGDILTYKQDGVLLAGSVLYICPGYTSALRSWLNSEEGNSQSSVTSSNGVNA
jgi:Protein of unknown function (DUF732)